MSRFPSLLLIASLAMGAWADPTIPPDAVSTVEDLVFPVEDIVPEVESLDGTESETRQGDEVIVALTSDVLFAVDKWVLTPKAKLRLKQVAQKVKTTGAVKIGGHTDDQGTDSYNLALSQRRALAVQRELSVLLPGLTFEAKGYGEAKPKLPNIIEGKPIAKNRASNRRVEIVFTAA